MGGDNRRSCGSGRVLGRLKLALEKIPHNTMYEVDWVSNGTTRESGEGRDIWCLS